MGMKEYQILNLKKEIQDLKNELSVKNDIINRLNQVIEKKSIELNAKIYEEHFSKRALKSIENVGWSE